MSTSSEQAADQAATVPVYFIEPSGKTVEVSAVAGDTLMEAAVSADVEGILAECGGGCSCGTCHVILVEDDFDRLGEPNPLEAGILDFVDNAVDFSRLSCQIDVNENLRGMRFRVGE
ncbi:MAG: 2Fe-2S iron-sulfur cluster-binding protein [Pseudomonadota bacterium]